MAGTWYEKIAPSVPAVNYPRASMTQEEKVMLTYVTRSLYSGSGAICDLGCGKGGSTFALCHGLAENPEAGTAARVHAYDWLELAQGDHADGHTEIFWKNVAPFKHLVSLHLGDLRDETWDDGDIEVLFVDVAKEVDLFQHVAREFFPALVPDVSIIIHQDFGRPRLPWLHYSTGMLLPFVDVLGIVEDSLVLKLVKPIPDELIEAMSADNFSMDERLSHIRHLQQEFGAETTKGFTYREVLGLSEAFVYFYAGHLDMARQVVDELEASETFLDYFRQMMAPIVSA